MSVVHEYPIEPPVTVPPGGGWYLMGIQDGKGTLTPTEDPRCAIHLREGDTITKVITSVPDWIVDQV